MRKSEYLKDKLTSILGLLMACLLSTGLLILVEMRGIFIAFFESIFIIAFAIVLFSEYHKRKSFYQNAWNILENLDKKTLLSELIIKPSFLDGEILYEILKISDKDMNDRIACCDRNSQDYREYIELWVHEIKTPITSTQLMVENDKNITTCHIGDEIKKIDTFVEQALYYARSTSVEKDFKVEKVTLKNLLMPAIKKYSKSIIQSNGTIDLHDLDYIVYTDRKFMEFVIGQIIINAVKYRKNCLRIQFNGIKHQNYVSLSIQDNGIGIPLQDLKRIFDKGFTGHNGRQYNKSTGIGLYLCKNLCQKMNLDIRIESIEGKTTTVQIIFPQINVIN
ncbi:sensor histidine kinase [Clostridium estertheticum]|uniref:sensor histidine kinase n=1 Tax=Clostridium estertheticum TaxID=238834 RepID=UPI001CF580D9|nr:sensor histidine kinase [Clostridium estertheticum]MCB2357497.1 sensor histidine kinase [Clostridium estertheticum]